jgi:hypothetical protein
VLRIEDREYPAEADMIATCRNLPPPTMGCTAASRAPSLLIQFGLGSDDGRTGTRKPTREIALGKCFQRFAHDQALPLRVPLNVTFRPEAE